MTEALSLKLAISWSVMPLNPLFCHLFRDPAVMHGMLRGYDAEEGDRYEREAEEAEPNLSRAEGTSSAQQQLLLSPFQLRCPVM